MPAVIVEKLESRKSRTDDAAQLDMFVDVFVEPEGGKSNEAVARLALVAQTPNVIDLYEDTTILIHRESIEITDILTETHFVAHIRYTSYAFLPSFEFDTTGGVQNFKYNMFGTTRRYPSSAPDFKGAIDVHGFGDDIDIHGVDVNIPVWRFQETHFISSLGITPQLKRKFFLLTGKVNMFPFREFDVGECLFLGVTGRWKTGDVAELTFSFAAEPNIYDFKVGDIVVPYKLGWEYVWARFKTESTGNNITTDVLGAYVEPLFEPADFFELGIGV